MPQRIIIRAPNHLGDSVMALPMISETREAYPNSQVTVLAPEGLADFYVGNSGVDRIMTIPSRYVHGLAGVMHLRDRVRAEAFDIGYVLPLSFSAASAFALAGVKERIGYIADGRRLLLTKPMPLPHPINEEHRSKVYFDLLRRSTGAQFEFHPPRLLLSDEDLAIRQELLAKFSIDPNETYVAIGFRSAAESRRWGEFRYGELCEWISAALKARVVLLGSIDDAAEGERIAQKIANDAVINLAGKTSVRELMAVLGGAILMVGDDSGVAHVAAAVGTPVIALFGAGDPKETGPLASKREIVRADHVDCLGCVKNQCPLKKEQFMRCMRELPLDRVIFAIRELVPHRPSPNVS